jgi:hypothetical protein
MSAGPLERRYRRLLWAYPRTYRRRHGAEILTTLLAMAEPGQSRPAAADAVDLIRGGLRQRFRLPVGRPVLILAAVLCAVIGGAFGAAAGSWAGVQTFADLPDEAALSVIADRAAAGGAEQARSRDGSPWYGESAARHYTVPPAWDAAAAGRALAAQGWRVGPVSDPGGAAWQQNEDGTQTRLSMRGGDLRAERDGLLLQVRGFVVAEQNGSVSVVVWPRVTAVFLPLIAAGALLGLVAGWLVAAALLRRHAARAPAGLRLAARVLTGAALLMLALPAWALYANMVRAFRHAGADGLVFTVHSAFTAGRWFPFGPSTLVLVLTLGGLLTGAVAAVLAAIARPAPRAQDVTA